MAVSRMAVVAAVVCALIAVAAAGPPTPVWPSKYRVSGTFDIPYWSLTAPFSLQMDSDVQAQALTWFNGLDSLVIDKANNRMVSRFPRVDSFQCTESPATGSDFDPILPDMSAFSFQGMERVNGWLVEHFVRTVTSFGLQQEYHFYVHRDMTTGAVRPIRYELHGTDISLGSGHPDIYIWTFNDWTPHHVDAAAFESSCTRTERVHPIVQTHRHNAKLMHGMGLMSMAGLPMLDTADAVEAAFHKHVLVHGKPVMGRGHYKQRLAVFRANHAMVTAHNARYAAGERSYSLRLNHFADLSLEERVALYSPRAQARVARGAPAAAKTRVPAMDIGLVSGNFSWVSRGAVNPVVDQAACGSCWAFGTVAALEGAVQIKTHKLPKLSEQQLVDCAWFGANQGCGGGFASSAYDWITYNGGIALEADYPYLGQNAMCANDTRAPGVQVKTYHNASTVSTALDLLAKGPCAVAIDAAAPPGDFYFYDKGVYDNAQCKSDPDSLDHEVTLVGYGEINGKMGALIKNSWSTHWGDEGYGYLALENNNCGWATQARQPELV